MKLGILPRRHEQRMHLHRRLGRAKQRPRKERQTQVDGCGVQRVGRVLQIDTEAVADVEFARLQDQALGKIGMDAPVPRLVGVGQRRTLDLLLEPHVIQLDGLRRQAGFDIAQTLAVGQLREGHRAELLGTYERLHVAIATMSFDDAGERGPRQKIHQLGEQCLAGVHGRLRVNYPRKSTGTPFCRSNRHHPRSLGIPPQSWLSTIRPLV